MNLAEQHLHRARQMAELVGDNPTFDLIVDLLDEDARVAACPTPEGGYLFHVQTKGRRYASRGRTMADAIERVWQKMTAAPESSRHLS